MEQVVYNMLQKTWNHYYCCLIPGSMWHCITYVWVSMLLKSYSSLQPKRQTRSYTIINTYWMRLSSTSSLFCPDKWCWAKRSWTKHHLTQQNWSYVGRGQIQQVFYYNKTHLCSSQSQIYNRILVINLSAFFVCKYSACLTLKGLRGGHFDPPSGFFWITQKRVKIFQRNFSY